MQITNHGRTLLRQSIASTALLRALLPPPTAPAPYHAFARAERERPYLHPTKGWRGKGTRPRGTNKRRVKP